MNRDLYDDNIARCIQYIDISRKTERFYSVNGLKRFTIAVHKRDAIRNGFPIHGEMKKRPWVTRA